MTDPSRGKGTLHIVATPIGNLGDITLRALETLKEVDLAAAEDTRHSRKLFSRYGIKTPLVSYYGAREAEKGEEILRALESGKNVALISDAGTPGISDPGHYLITRAIEKGHPIFTLPGPSAIISALTISGLPMGRFSFEGFLPPKKGARKTRLEALIHDDRTIVFYESPKRTVKTLKEVFDILGDRKAVVVRELTKLYEEVVRGQISDIISELSTRDLKGEVTILVSGCAEKETVSEEPLDILACDLLNKGMSVKDAAEIISKRTRQTKKEVYKNLLELKERGIND